MTTTDGGDVLALDLSVATARVQALAHIDSPDTYRLAGHLLTQVIARVREIQTWYAEERAPFIEVQKKVREREKLALDPWQSLQDVLQTAMREYETETKAARRAALEAAMATAAATQVPVKLPDLVADLTVPKVEGLQTREHWTAEVTAFPLLVVGAGIAALLDIWDAAIAGSDVRDPDAVRIVKAFLEQWQEIHGAASVEALLPNVAWLNEQARQAHGALKLPGVTAVKRETYARGRKGTT